ncbi:MAG: glycoside hydrolase family 3 C-terminal domain-containing protein [Herbinix sp.]|nr:glycoside hydrolase family 3 C-terminal domain-containing protein [Herbinix sp.]
MFNSKEYRLKFTDRAKKIVEQMSLEEKVYLMSGRISLEDVGDVFNNPGPDNHYNIFPYPAGGNERLGVPELKFCDGPRGVVCYRATCFPVTMARGATFDTELEEEVGEAIAREIRAFGGNYFGGVCVNLPYNPGWGRSQEVYGEDTYHLGAMGSALVKGVQKHNVVACVKHYAFNSMEEGRFRVSVDASRKTEREIYLRHFKDCIDAGAASVMSAYNKHKGTHLGENEYLLRDVLKDEWDFDGFVVSDFIWGTKSTVDAANNGLDVEMCNTNYYGDKLVEAVKENKVKESVIDEAALRIVRTLLAAAEAEDPETYERSVISCDKHIALAKKAAAKAMTLVKNENDVLPLSKKLDNILVLGKLANVENIGDHGSSRVFPYYTVTPLQGIVDVAKDSKVTYYSGEDIEKAADLAKKADAVIMVVGYDNDDEGEFLTNEDSIIFEKCIGGDRRDLGIHQNEVDLVNAVGKVNKNNAVVLIGGNMILVDNFEANASSILMAYYPGMEGGSVIAETLFGDNNPGGKLPFVLVKDAKDLPEVDWDAEEIVYDYYHGYARLEKNKVAPYAPYGFGLSYTTFDIKGASCKVDNNVITAQVEVTNTGKVAGDEVIQLYVGKEDSSVDRPVRALKGFMRVTLQPGETKTVTVTTPVSKLEYYCENDNVWKLESGKYQAYIGNCLSDEHLTKVEFEVK